MARLHKGGGRGEWGSQTRRLIQGDGRMSAGEGARCTPSFPRTHRERSGGGAALCCVWCGCVKGLGKRSTIATHTGPGPLLGKPALLPLARRQHTARWLRALEALLNGGRLLLPCWLLLCSLRERRRRWRRRREGCESGSGM